jgi:hypothetical protein
MVVEDVKVNELDKVIGFSFDVVIVVNILVDDFIAIHFIGHNEIIDSSQLFFYYFVDDV